MEKEEYVKQFLSDLIKAGIKVKNMTQEIPHNRYLSWEHCYKKFSNTGFGGDSKLIEELALNLGFYLASWGMYRGSTFLLQYDYKVHKNVVENVLLSEQVKELYGLNLEKMNPDEAKEKLGIIVNKKGKNKSIKQQIIETYNMEDNNKEATDTLVTKILLGTTGCIPAYDRYLQTAIKRLGSKQKVLNEKTINWLVDLYYLLEKESDFKELKQMNYPSMKILDMCLWQYGRELQDIIILYGGTNIEINQIKNNILDELSKIDGKTEKEKDRIEKAKKYINDQLGVDIQDNKNIEYKEMPSIECFMQVKQKGEKYVVKVNGKQEEVNKNRLQRKILEIIKLKFRIK